MHRGTTPTLIFTVPYGAEQITDGFVTFAQRGSVCLEKRINEPGVEVTDSKISVTLTQKETLSMTTSDECNAQIRLRIGEKAVASQIIKIPVCEILKDGEI